MNIEQAIEELEAHGYSVMKPRDRQGEWEDAVARLLGDFHVYVHAPIQRHQVEMRGRSASSLTIMRAEISEMLERFNARKAAAE